MSDVVDQPSAPSPAPPLLHIRAVRGHSTWRDRVGAAIEVALCSGYPTQIALVYLLAVGGVSPAGRAPSLGYVALLLLLDATIVMALVWWLLHVHGESLRQTMLGHRRLSKEVLLGLPLTFVVFALVIVILACIQRFAPWLHNVPDNPLEQLVRSGRDAVVFALVATFAGGLREEVQRAFVLRRFDRHLGGAGVGVAVFSVAFGAGHALQGWDAAMTTGVLGALWGLVYLARGSVVAPVVSHSVFNIAEIARFSLWGG